jgi:hypothetical protein
MDLRTEIKIQPEFKIHTQDELIGLSEKFKPTIEQKQDAWNSLFYCKNKVFQEVSDNIKKRDDFKLWLTNCDDLLYRLAEEVAREREEKKKLGK